MKLHVNELGQGFPLIILHGLFGSGDNWLTLAKRFSQNFKVYLVDQRNHGNSVHCNHMNYELMANDLHEFCIDRNINHTHVLGHSMGGKTAMMFSALHSDIVEKLCVIDIAPKNYKPHHNGIINALLNVDFNVLKSRKDIDQFLEQFIAEPSVRQFLLKNLKRNEKKFFEWKMNLVGISENYDELIRFPDITPISKETLFLSGEKSNYITEVDEDDIYQIFYNSQIEEVKDAGHWIHAEKPEEFYKIVYSFLQ